LSTSEFWWSAALQPEPGEVATALQRLKRLPLAAARDPFGPLAPSCSRGHRRRRRARSRAVFELDVPGELLRPEEIDRCIDDLHPAVDQRVVSDDVRRVLLLEEQVSGSELVVRERRDEREAILADVELDSDHVRVDGLPLIDEQVEEKGGDDISAVAQANEEVAATGDLLDVGDVPRFCGRVTVDGSFLGSASLGSASWGRGRVGLGVLCLLVAGVGRIGLLRGSLLRERD